MIGLHLWLTEAHVEAPTAGSVILAGILLKLGTYGFIRFSLPLFPVASMYFTPLMYTVSVIGVIYAALTAMRQTDLKRIVAYSSVSHMGLIVIGIFSMNAQGLEGSVIQQLSHGLVSGALFVGRFCRTDERKGSLFAFRVIILGHDRITQIYLLLSMLQITPVFQLY